MERSLSRLEVLKALGDNTRYAIYLELARSPRALATAEIADVLELHPNTVRPHLERMREVGLLTVESEARGSVGRPQHRYSLAPDAPSLGLEPATFPLLAGMLLQLAGASGIGGEDAAEVGRDQGHVDGRDAGPGSCVDALVARLGELGFDPALVTDEDRTTVAFTHCPFEALAEANPEVICGLHLGLVEGFVEVKGGATVDQFHSLLDRTPCRVDLVTG